VTAGGEIKPGGRAIDRLPFFSARQPVNLDSFASDCHSAPRLLYTVAVLGTPTNKSNRTRRPLTPATTSCRKCWPAATLKLTWQQSENWSMAKVGVGAVSMQHLSPIKKSEREFPLIEKKIELDLNLACADECRTLL